MKIILTVENFNKIMKSCKPSLGKPGSFYGYGSENIKLEYCGNDVVIAYSLTMYSFAEVKAVTYEASDRGIMYIPYCKPIRKKPEWKNRFVDVVIESDSSYNYTVTVDSHSQHPEVIYEGKAENCDEFLDTNSLFKNFSETFEARTIYIDPEKLYKILEAFIKTGDPKPIVKLTVVPDKLFVKIEDKRGDIKQTLLAYRPPKD